MKMIRETVNTSSGNFSYEKPNFCPHCGIAINANCCNPIPIGGKFYVILFQCTMIDCKKHFYATYSSTGSGMARDLRMNTTYPLPASHDIPRSLFDLSPEFARFCAEANAAENLGHEMLAACGYRNGIECLLKDYAVKYQGCKLSQDELRRLTINECIKRYLDTLDVSVSAYFAKEEGNKATHYPKLEDEPFSFEEFMVYFGLLLSTLDSQVKIREIAQKLPSKFTKKFESPNGDSQ